MEYFCNNEWRTKQSPWNKYLYPVSSFIIIVSYSKLLALESQDFAQVVFVSRQGIRKIFQIYTGSPKWNTHRSASFTYLLYKSSFPATSRISCLSRIFESQGGGSRAAGGISVVRPALLEASLRRSARAVTLDVRVERTRLNLSLPFLLRLAKSLLDAMPGEGAFRHYKGHYSARFPT